MMNGWSSGMDAGAWVFMGVFWLLLVAGIVVLAARLFPRPGHGSRDERPGEILDRRLAAGEIDIETYERLRAKLHCDVAVDGR